MEQTTEAGLVRGIRKWDLVALIVNSVVVALIILCFAEVGSRFQGTGGPYLYAREAFGPAAGFQVGWMFWLARLTSSATNCNLLVVYLGHFWPAANDGGWRAAIITFVIVSLTAINYV